MLGGFKRLVVVGLAAVTLGGPLALTGTSASAAGWHRYPYARYYHHRYYRHYGYWPGRSYYGYGPPPLLGALVGGITAVALAPAALLAPSYYYGPPPYYYYGPGPYWW
jgi:hypothetical protein